MTNTINGQAVLKGTFQASIVLLLVLVSSVYASIPLVVQNKPLKPKEVAQKQVDFLSKMESKLVSRQSAHNAYLQATNGAEKRVFQCADNIACTISELDAVQKSTQEYANSLIEHANAVRVLEEDVEFLYQTQLAKGNEYWDDFEQKREQLTIDIEQASQAFEQLGANADMPMDADKRLAVGKMGIFYNKTLSDLFYQMQEIMLIDQSATTFKRVKSYFHEYAVDTELNGRNLDAAAFENQRKQDVLAHKGYLDVTSADIVDLVSNLNVIATTPVTPVQFDIDLSHKENSSGVVYSGSGINVMGMFDEDSAKMFEMLKNFKRKTGSES